jgi:hypothetical protein
MAKNIALGLLLAVVVATYWRPLRRFRVALGLDYLLSTGHMFLLLGGLLGLAFGERPTPTAHAIGPIVALAAGWIGFATGMRFDVRVLRTVPARVFVAALLPGLVAAATVAAGSFAMLRFAGVTATSAWGAALVLAAAAASSGPTIAAVLRRRRAGRSSLARPVLRMIEFSAGVDDIVVVVIAMLSFALFRPGADPVDAAWLMVLGLGGGVLLGGVTWLFLGGRATEDERLLLGLAMLAITAGFAGWLLFSPAGLAAITAIVLVNLPGDRMDRLVEAVRRVERPAVVILMTVIGFHVTGSVTWLFWPLFVAMTLVRLAAKHFASVGVTTGAADTSGLRTRRGWGSGLAPQGVLGLMVALSFFHVWQDEVARTVLAAVAAASILNELWAPWLILRLLRGLSPPGARPTPGEVA